MPSQDKYDPRNLMKAMRVLVRVQAHMLARIVVVEIRSTDLAVGVEP